MHREYVSIFKGLLCKQSLELLLSHSLVHPHGLPPNSSTDSKRRNRKHVYDCVKVEALRLVDWLVKKGRLWSLFTRHDLFLYWGSFLLSFSRWWGNEPIRSSISLLVAEKAKSSLIFCAPKVICLWRDSLPWNCFLSNRNHQVSSPPLQLFEMLGAFRVDQNGIVT